MAQGSPSLRRIAPAVALLSCVCAPGAGRASDFVHYESSHVHPIALSEAGDRLFAVNTPDARLSVFDVAEDGRLRLAREVPVGLEPVSLGVRPGTDEVWVVNHLSDSVSVVDAATGRVIDTLAVGDEPTDVAFASGRAFVSLAGREDRVVVYDAALREEVASLDVFGDDPRALAVSPDGSRLALVVLESGNRTTVLHPLHIAAGGGPPEPDPPRDPGLPFAAPDDHLIVRYDPAAGQWRDETGSDWSAAIDYALPDLDVFWIDAATATLDAAVSDVGTTLFDVAFHPLTGEAWVPNTEARNLVRFEPVLRGHLVETRVSVVGASDVTHHDLNPHIDRSQTPGPPEELALSLAQPGDGVFDPDGSRYYLTAFGSAKVAVLDGATGAVLSRIEVPGGPSGLALSPGGERLYVMSRFRNALSVVDLAAGRAFQHVGVAGPAFFDPSPAAVRAGRRFLYDAQRSSGHGDLSCATCHVFANFDGIAWDLGDPTAAFVYYEDADWLDPAPESDLPGFDPMKGPMVTQTLRGLRGTEPFHWRGDRRDFQHFNGAFASLLGRAEPLPDADMDTFAEFIMTVALPPNPHRGSDDSLPDSVDLSAFAAPPGDPGRGAQLFANRQVEGLSCTSCHAAPHGTSFAVVSAGGAQDFEVAQLRNTYEKIGFGVMRTEVGFVANSAALEQKSGFGVLHGGGFSLLEFIIRTDFNQAPGDAEDLAAFVMSFPTGTFPCVGRQQTVTSATLGQVFQGFVALLAQARLGRCDLIARGTVDDADFGWAFERAGDRFLPDRAGDPVRPGGGLNQLLRAGDSVTYMGVPPGSGVRMGIDRDRDGCLDGDEADAGTDPAGPGRPTDTDGDGSPDVCIRPAPEPDAGVGALAALAVVAYLTVTVKRRLLRRPSTSSIWISTVCLPAGSSDSATSICVPSMYSRTLSVMSIPQAILYSSFRLPMSTGLPRGPAAKATLMGKGPW